VQRRVSPKRFFPKILTLFFFSDIIVKQDYFDLPADMTRTEVKAVFDSFIRKDNLYWHNLSITVIYLLAQIKIAKKDMRRLLSQDDDDLGL